MNNLNREALRSVDNNKVQLEYSLVIQNGTKFSKNTQTLDQDTYSTSESSEDFPDSDLEMDLSNQSSRTWISASKNEVYFQELDANIVFPESYKCTVGRKSRTHAFKIEDISRKRGSMYSNLIRAISNQKKCENCFKGDKCYCQDGSQVLLTALQRLFLTNDSDKAPIIPSLEESRKISTGYSEKNNQRSKYTNNRNDNHIVVEELLKTQIVKPLQLKQLKRTKDREIREELVYPEKEKQLKRDSQKRTNGPEVVEELIGTRKVLQLETNRPKKMTDGELFEEDSIQTHKIPQVGTELSEIRYPENISENENPSLHAIQEEIIEKRHVNRLLQHSNPTQQKKYGRINFQVPEYKRKSSDISKKTTEILENTLRYVDTASSMPLKTFQSCSTDPKSITKTSICLQANSTMNRNDTKNQEYKVLVDSYPIGDSDILNTYHKEIVYTLDRIIEELQRLKFKKGRYKTKGLCFARNVDTQTNQNNELKKCAPCYCPSVTRSKYFNACSYDEFFEGMDNNDYLRMILRTKIGRMKGFDDFIDKKINSQHKT